MTNYLHNGINTAGRRSCQRQDNKWKKNIDVQDEMRRINAEADGRLAEKQQRQMLLKKAMKEEAIKLQAAYGMVCTSPSFIFLFYWLSRCYPPYTSGRASRNYIPRKIVFLKSVCISCYVCTFQWRTSIQN